MSTLYVVATPIGNLEDITLRALRVLNSVDLILCEDTRTTKILLNKHSITTKTLSYHVHSKISRTEEIISLLKSGKNIALVSDAGTPGISDPGTILVTQIRQECFKQIENGEIKIESVPGPSAVIAALSIAGVPCADFTFLGFLPHKKGRETLFKEISTAERTIVFYESPHRILKTLASLALYAEKTVNIHKTVTVCRELTKIFEEVVAGTPDYVKTFFDNNQEKVRGEFVVIVSKD
jgi:16S rRNA (cytidine1402-2'-O)-methyltransferase